jgi:HSP20 family protein
MNNSLINWDPFRELDEMHDSMNRLLNRSLSGTNTLAGLMPATDIFEQDGKLIIETALPSFKDDEVDVQINGDRLEVKAERKADNERKDRNYLRRESSTASYYRQFVLPKDIDVESGSAHFENGVLTVMFDRKELPQPKKLTLGSGQKDQKKLAAKSEK